MITAQVLVKNEENFIWYSVMSVIHYVEKMMIWDTGSSDNTRNIVKRICAEFPDKVSFEEIGEVDEEKYSDTRQRMLDGVKSGWIFILDGDEIWWEESIKKVTG